jgi:glycopeptide antibiotics resistance protein
MRFDLELLVWLLGTFAILTIPVFVLRRRGHGWPWLFFFFVLLVYLSLVARETLVYHGVDGRYFGEPRIRDISQYVNLVPGRAGPHDWDRFDMEQVVLNVVLGFPLGFGITLVWPLRLRALPWLALGFGAAIEVLQFISSLAVGSPRHIADINDVLLNAAGVTVGYGVFRGSAWVYSHGFARLGKTRSR